VERGRLIAFEGGEACGKSTQAALLAADLGALLTREPGGTAVGERVRSLLLEVPPLLLDCFVTSPPLPNPLYPFFPNLARFDSLPRLWCEYRKPILLAIPSGSTPPWRSLDQWHRPE